MSGNLEPETREALAPLRPVGLLSKPILPVQLTRVLRDHAAERAAGPAAGTT